MLHLDTTKISRAIHYFCRGYDDRIAGGDERPHVTRFGTFEGFALSVVYTMGGEAADDSGKQSGGVDWNVKLMLDINVYFLTGIEYQLCGSPERPDTNAVGMKAFIAGQKYAMVAYEGLGKNLRP